MPLAFHQKTNSSYNTTTLDQVQYINHEGERYFRLSNFAQNFEIRVGYVPNFESKRDPNRYECVLFENPYLVAENDVYEVFESTLTGRLGWIFPMSALDSNDNNYAEDSSFKHYRHIAYQKLLMSNYDVEVQIYKDEYTISELFKGLSVFIISKDETIKLESFRITDYALSFLRHDYLIFRKVISGKKCFNKDEEIERLRKGSHKIKIRKAAFDVTSNQYTNTLFIEHIYQTENTLIKYILLYQILEQFIQDFGDEILDEIFKEYLDKKITKNTLKEKIAKVQSDRTLMKKIFETTVIKSELRQSFLSKCTFLFNDLNLGLDKNFEDALYDFRNLITHSYRLLTNKKDDMDELIHLFESIIIDLLIGFNENAEKIENVSAIKEIELEEKDSEKVVSETNSLKQKLVKIWNRIMSQLIISPYSL